MPPLSKTRRSGLRRDIAIIAGIVLAGAIGVFVWQRHDAEQQDFYTAHAALLVSFCKTDLTPNKATAKLIEFHNQGSSWGQAFQQLRAQVDCPAD